MVTYIYIYIERERGITVARFIETVQFFLSFQALREPSWEPLGPGVPDTPESEPLLDSVFEIFEAKKPLREPSWEPLGPGVSDTPESDPLLQTLFLYIYGGCWLEL
jgi:hypothetical protein